MLMNIWNILNSLGCVALFLYGMKIMSDGIQHASGSGLRKFLSSITDSNLKTLLAGVGLTSVIQSSSAVSVLTLSFVNAGLINLMRAFALIIGANIGTTFTLWIVSLGFEIKISTLSLSLLALVIPFFFFGKSKTKKWASFFIGFALIFISLSLLRQNLEPLAKESFLIETFGNFNPRSTLNAILFVLIGLVLTIIVQSSSASTSFMVVLFTLGLPLEACAMMIIGANIGTTTTAQIAATIGNKNAKYTAYFHAFFNVFGGFLFFFLAFFTMDLVGIVFEDHFYMLAAFHTIFNIVTAIVLFPFLPKIVEFTNKRKLKTLSEENLQMMHSPFNVSPELYIYEAKNMLSSFASNISQTVNSLGRMITESDDNKFNELHQRVLKLEDEGDVMEEKIRTYLNKLYKMDISGENSKTINHLINVSKELENIGDLAIKTSYTHLERRETNSFITPSLRTYLLEIQDALSSATTNFVQNLNEIHINPELPTSKKLEKRINEIHEEAFDTLLKTLEKDKIKPKSAMYYRELIQNYELIGDHIYKANKSLVS